MATCLAPWSLCWVRDLQWDYTWLLGGNRVTPGSLNVTSRIVLLLVRKIFRTLRTIGFFRVHGRTFGSVRYLPVHQNLTANKGPIHLLTIWAPLNPKPIRLQGLGLVQALILDLNRCSFHHGRRRVLLYS